jgi:hypothetical protein
VKKNSIFFYRKKTREREREKKKREREKKKREGGERKRGREVKILPESC